MNDLTSLVLVIAVVAMLTVLLRRRTGRALATSERFSSEQLSAIGAAGEGSHLVLFTAPGCSPCTAARRVLDEVGMRHGARVLAVDVTEHPDIARDKSVWRAPTVFVVRERGHAVARISGVPRADALEAALGTPAAAA